MKKVKYEILGYTGIYNPETDKTEQVTCLVGVERPYSDENLAVAQKEAYNGEYAVEDDGQPEPEATPEERIAELEEALSLLLSGVTE